MTRHERRVLDLSGGTYVPPQQRPQVQRQLTQQQIQAQASPVQQRQQAQPVHIPPVQSSNRQNVIFQGVSNPTVTQTGTGPFDAVRRMQDNISQAQQLVGTTPQVPTPRRTSEEAPQQKVKDSSVLVNGCDVSGCTTIAEAYEKNKGKIKFLLA